MGEWQSSDVGRRCRVKLFGRAGYVEISLQSRCTVPSIPWHLMFVSKLIACKPLWSISIDVCFGILMGLSNTRLLDLFVADSERRSSEPY